MVYKVKFDTGEVVSFQRQPTDDDINEVVKKLGIKPKSASIPEDSIQPPEPKSTLKKIGETFTSGRLLDKPSKFLFGTLGETVGKLHSTVGEGISELITGKTVEQRGKERQGFDVGGRGVKSVPSAFDIGFTVLETLPGGGALKNLLKKLPGGAKTIGAIDDAIKVLPDKMKEKAIKLYTEALAPTTKKTKQQAEKIVPELLKRKVKAGVLTGLGGIEKTAQRGKGKVGPTLEAAIEQLDETTKLKAEPILSALREFEEKALVPGTKIVAEPAQVAAAQEIKKIILELGDDISVKSIRGLRQIWDTTIKKAGKGFGLAEADSFKLAAKKEATNAIRGVIADASPTVAKLNKEYAFWSNVSEVVGETLTRKSGQVGKKGRAGQILGGILGSTLGPKATAVGIFIGGKLDRAFSTATWQTKKAIWKNNFADKLLNGDINTVLLLLKELGVVTNNEIKNLDVSSGE